MKRTLLICHLGLAFLLGLLPAAFGQAAPAAAAELSNATAAATPADAAPINREVMVVVGKDVLLLENETTRGIVVVSGSATIKGTVRGDVTVLSGSAVVEGTVERSLVVFSGSATLGPQARIKRDVVVVGGFLKQQPTTKIGGKQVTIQPETISPGFGWFKDWFAKGLLWARPLPPQFLWVWVMAAVFLFGYALMQILFPRPIKACVETLEQRPIGSFFIGLLLFALFGPLVFLLAISMIGLVIIPFLLCAIIVAVVFGKIAVYRYTGQQVARQLGFNTEQRPLAALLVGAIIFYLLYAVPILGFVVWGAVVPLGLGATVLACYRSLRTETGKATADDSVVAGEPALVPAFTILRVGFWWRFFATFLDFLLLGTLIRLLRVPHFFLPLWTIYHIAMWTWKGTTMGGLVLGIRIAREDGSAINFPIALVRALASFFSAAALFLGFFWAGWSRSKRSWHDRIAGTIVVKQPRAASLNEAEPPLQQGQTL